MRINGKVVYQNLGPGCWGVVDKSGKEYRLVNMPEQLKHEGEEVSLIVKEVDDMSMFMWGTAVRVISFHTLAP